MEPNSNDVLHYSFRKKFYGISSRDLALLESRAKYQQEPLNAHRKAVKPSRSEAENTETGSETGNMARSRSSITNLSTMASSFASASWKKGLQVLAKREKNKLPLDGAASMTSTGSETKQTASTESSAKSAITTQKSEEASCTESQSETEQPMLHKLLGNFSSPSQMFGISSSSSSPVGSNDDLSTVVGTVTTLRGDIKERYSKMTGVHYTDHCATATSPREGGSFDMIDFNEYVPRTSSPPAVLIEHQIGDTSSAYSSQIGHPIRSMATDVTTTQESRYDDVMTVNTGGHMSTNPLQKMFNARIGTDTKTIQPKPRMGVNSKEEEEENTNTETKFKASDDGAHLPDKEEVESTSHLSRQQPITSWKPVLSLRLRRNTKLQQEERPNTKKAPNAEDRSYILQVWGKALLRKNENNGNSSSLPRKWKDLFARKNKHVSSAKTDYKIVLENNSNYNQVLAGNQGGPNQDICCSQQSNNPYVNKMYMPLLDLKALTNRSVNLSGAAKQCIIPMTHFLVRTTNGYKTRFMKAVKSLAVAKSDKCRSTDVSEMEMRKDDQAMNIAKSSLLMLKNPLISTENDEIEATMQLNEPWEIEMAQTINEYPFALRSMDDVLDSFKSESEIGDVPDLLTPCSEAENVPDLLTPKPKLEVMPDLCTPTSEVENVPEFLTPTSGKHGMPNDPSPYSDLPDLLTTGSEVEKLVSTSHPSIASPGNDMTTRYEVPGAERKELLSPSKSLSSSPQNLSRACPNPCIAQLESTTPLLQLLPGKQAQNGSQDNHGNYVLPREACDDAAVHQVKEQVQCFHRGTPTAKTLRDESENLQGAAKETENKGVSGNTTGANMDLIAEYGRDRTTTTNPKLSGMPDADASAQNSNVGEVSKEMPTSKQKRRSGKNKIACTDLKTEQYGDPKDGAYGLEHSDSKPAVQGNTVNHEEVSATSREILPKPNPPARNYDDSSIVKRSTWLHVDGNAIEIKHSSATGNNVHVRPSEPFENQTTERRMLSELRAQAFIKNDELLSNKKRSAKRRTKKLFQSKTNRNKQRQKETLSNFDVRIISDSNPTGEQTVPKLSGRGSTEKRKREKKKTRKVKNNTGIIRPPVMTKTKDGGKLDEEFGIVSDIAGLFSDFFYPKMHHGKDGHVYGAPFGCADGYAINENGSDSVLDGLETSSASDSEDGKNEFWDRKKLDRNKHSNALIEDKNESIVDGECDENTSAAGSHVLDRMSAPCTLNCCHFKNDKNIGETTSKGSTSFSSSDDDDDMGDNEDEDGSLDSDNVPNYMGTDIFVEKKACSSGLEGNSASRDIFGQWIQCSRRQKTQNVLGKVAAEGKPHRSMKRFFGFVKRDKRTEKSAESGQPRDQIGSALPQSSAKQLNNLSVSFLSDSLITSTSWTNNSDVFSGVEGQLKVQE